MADIFDFTAQTRTEFGKAASRRLRKQEDKVPAVIYGAGKAPSSIVLSHKTVTYALAHEAIYSHILTIDVDGKKERVVLKDLDRHPSKPRILHLDFLRIKAKEKLTMNIPIHFLGEAEAPGVKEGGVFSKHMLEVEIRCLPADLPESIDLDVSTMQLDETFHLSDLKLPKNVELTIPELDEEHNQAVISLHIPKVVEEAVAAEEAEVEAEAGEPTEGEQEQAEGTAASEAQSGKKEETEKPKKSKE